MPNIYIITHHTAIYHPTRSRASPPPSSSKTTSLAASLVLLDLLSGKFDRGLGAGLRLSLHPRLDLRRHGQKGLFDIGAGLGRGLQKLNAQRIGKLLALLRAHDAFGGQIGLVADQQLVDIFRRVSVNLVQPLLDIVEGLGVRHVVDNNNTMGAAVVGRSDGSETFLPGRVPDLKLDGLAIEVNGADFLQRGGAMGSRGK